MTERQVVIGHRLGLHARASARVVQLASQFQSSIVLFKSDNGQVVEADARSILAILFLAAAFGATLTVRANGADEVDAVDCLCEYLKG